MEDIHGVDVSWLHHSTKDHHHRQHAPSSPGVAGDALPRTSSHGGLQHSNHERDAHPTNPEPPPAVQPPSAPAPAANSTTPPQKSSTKRPALLNRSGSDKPGSLTSPEARTGSRRNSWISSISSKFSSQNPPAQMTHAQAQGSHAPVNGTHSTSPTANGALNGIQSASGNSSISESHHAHQQSKVSFISNALRRLSSGSQVGPISKITAQGGLCPRKVMNLDPNRNRCLVPELDENKLRRVAFCVDVEIAGGPRYDDDADCEEKTKKRKDRKLKERGEGEALRNPDAVAEEKDKAGAVTVNTALEVVGTEDTPHPEGIVVDDEKKEGSKKKEKKKRSEAERKERKEKKRRKAEENGSIPLELTMANEQGSTDGGSGSAITKSQDRPTTDPLRIYRRCCQLRETPILKRISDQLSSPSACSTIQPGVVTSLDLTGSRLQLADVITLSDWLAVVPVKKLFLEDADLTDEKVRVVLAGLLAAKVPEPSRRRLHTDEGERNIPKQAKSGVIKKLVLKNNPKITAEGWRHISLFIYMCKSIIALDISMMPFPSSAIQLSPQITNSSQESTNRHSISPRCIADTVSKAISERLGGSQLEEILMAECSLDSQSIRKIIDGCIISGVQRLGLAGNDIDEAGIGHVLHYIRSGVCQGLDLGGNNLQSSLGALVENLTKSCPLWALSLADCNLTPESLKTLFPALVSLPSFRFLDLSRNRDLFSNQTSLCLLRKYIPHFKELKRIHLMDVSLTPAEAIGIAEVLPECAHIAHISILENPQISALATAKDEESQEEAAALYASLTVAAKLSRSLICIDIDVPTAETSEVVKALAKQTVAYCLRNMENLSEIPELKSAPKEVEIPDVLMHLVGHTDDSSINMDNHPPAPDEDYIVGGTGVAKALSYCLSQKASDIRRQSLPASGTVTPSTTRNEDSEELNKAKTLSKNLLDSARNIRQRLQPALTREARAGSDMGYRRLLYLDETLKGMIQRFEDEYPETRLQPHDNASTHSSSTSSPPTSSVPTLSTIVTETGGQESDDDEPKTLRPSRNSDVSLASRALSLEEGRLHRLGHRVRTELLNPSRPSSVHSHQASVSGTMDHHDLPEHLLALREKFANFTGDELRHMTEGVGWEKAFDHIIDNAEQLKRLEMENPEEFRMFRESQIAALKNRNPDICPEPDRVRGAEGVDDCAVEDG